MQERTALLKFPSDSHHDGRQTIKCLVSLPFCPFTIETETNQISTASVSAYLALYIRTLAIELGRPRERMMGPVSRMARWQGGECCSPVGIGETVYARSNGAISDRWIWIRIRHTWVTQSYFLSAPERRVGRRLRRIIPGEVHHLGRAPRTWWSKAS